MHTVSKIKRNKSQLQLDESQHQWPSIKDKKTYKRQLKHWQTELLHVQQAYFHQGRRAIIVFEGWDAAGKGGAIRRLTQRLDPRGFKVYPIAAPTSEEQGKHYLYRFMTKLPSPGTIAIFDRSYYGRVLVERVEGIATSQQWQRAYQEINEFERLLIDDDVRIVKLFLNISSDEQLKRFEGRLEDPYKRWKLTSEDIRNRQKRGEYVNAINTMFNLTHTQSVPWYIIAAQYKWFARIDVLKTVVKQLRKGIDISPPALDPSLEEITID
ncbi:polyphosphate kinase 2 family protein [Pseudoalteromonas sp. ZZD1]|uniref:polyphosphate kinase 2 family protein n=1 Tax=Pseudoalteromonas sp. ZZD1 TaxID=3139395 RepID=UPI003BAA6908